MDSENFGKITEMEAGLQSWGSARVFSYKEIKSITNNFKEAIGRGSFGCVYVGKLPGGKQVAVKVRFDKTQLGAESFMNEVLLLPKVAVVVFYIRKPHVHSFRCLFYHKFATQILCLWKDSVVNQSTKFLCMSFHQEGR